jgi:hypothetical protein
MAVVQMVGHTREVVVTCHPAIGHCFDLVPLLADWGSCLLEVVAVYPKLAVGHCSDLVSLLALVLAVGNRCFLEVARMVVLVLLRLASIVLVAFACTV